MLLILVEVVVLLSGGESYPMHETILNTYSMYTRRLTTSFIHFEQVEGGTFHTLRTFCLIGWYIFDL